MHPIAFHVNFHPANRQVIAPSVGARRRLASILLAEEHRADLLTFRAVDTHVHLLVLCDRARAGRLVQRVGSALRQALGLPVPFEPAWYEPVLDQRHLVKAFLYVARNADNHGFGADPHHEASALPDILGMRRLAPELGLRVRERLGRLSPGDLEPILGVPIPEPAFHADHLLDAACASLALPHLRGNAPGTVRLRRAVARLALEELGATEIAELLGCDRRSVVRLAHTEEDSPLALAIGRQMAFRHALAQKSGTCRTGGPLLSQKSPEMGHMSPT
jgi:hypothetical protein